MIYLVSKQKSLFGDSSITEISLEDSLKLMKDWKMIQFDTETTGRDAHLCDILCMQFGNVDGDTQVVVDTTTVSPLHYKELLETRYIIGQNLKFDLQFLYKYEIIPRRIYDTMIVEQLLHLGYPSGVISYSLKEIAWRRLGVNIDKTVRGEIIWRGLDTKVIMYAAGDVKYLGDILYSQIKDCKKQGLVKAAQIECDFVPVIAYLEWCGIHLDQDKWQSKMNKDKKNLAEAKKALDSFVENIAIATNTHTCVVEEDFLVSTDSYAGHKDFSIPHKAIIIKGSEHSITGGDTVTYNYIKIRRPFPFCEINLQGDLFNGFDTSPHCIINWSSSKQVVNFAKFLGFDTQVKDQKTGEDKDSVLEKHLKTQKGINDEFLKLYFAHQEYAKVVTSFGQGHLNAINPKTDRIHTIYKQLGAASGRMSCGSQQSNTDLARLKNIPAKECTYPNIQQLPSDDDTRGAFTAPTGYRWVSCDFSALESRLGADIYNETSMLNEFLHGSGDMHSLCAYMVYKEIPRDTPIKDIKKLYPHLRKAVKGIEFSQQFGGSEYAIMGAMGCSLEEALAFKNAYSEGFPGIAKFKEQGSKFVRANGYILMCKYSGHKMYWWDHKNWLKRQQSFTPEFWDNYKLYHKGTNDEIAKEVSMHFKAASKWDRLALNSVTQGSGSVILKMAMTSFFNWIVDNNYFNKIEISALVHDEADVIYKEDIDDVPKVLEKCMEEAAAIVCTKLPIPAEAEVSDHWIH